MKVAWLAGSYLPVQEMFRNVEHARSLGLPGISSKERPSLAVIAGGPSIEGHIAELRAWRGDRWACGSAFQWCRRNGIEAVFVNIDPGKEMKPEALGAKHALLSTTTHRDVFEVVESAEVFDLIYEGKGINHGTTTATACPHLSLEMGYRDVSFFGCESSFEGQTHAYKHEDKATQFRVTCSGQEFMATAQHIMQAECLARFLRMVDIWKDRSGGLLSALITDLEYDVEPVNRAAFELLGMEFKEAA